MTSFLLTISFLLHIIAFTVIFQLFKQLQLYKSENTSDVMEIFDTYLEEIKTENKTLQATIALHSSESDSKPFKKTPDQSVQPGEKRDEDHTDHTLYMPYADFADDHVEASLQARILQLHHEGLRETDIARKLNCGKTEVALIIKLHGKKDIKA